MPVPSTQDLLDEAIIARHALLTGKSVVSIRTPEGRSLQYTTTSLAALDAYIAELRALLAGTAPRAFRNRISYVQPL